MRRIVFTIFLMAFVTGSGRLIAEPGLPSGCCGPKPVGGVERIRANAIYPQLALDFKLEGDVVVAFQVDETGHVSQIKVIKSAGPAFDESAIAAIVKTQWEPARQNGKTVSVVYAQEFNYILP